MIIRLKSIILAAGLLTIAVSSARCDTPEEAIRKTSQGFRKPASDGSFPDLPVANWPTIQDTSSHQKRTVSSQKAGNEKYVASATRAKAGQTAGTTSPEHIDSRVAQAEAVAASKTKFAAKAGQQNQTDASGNSISLVSQTTVSYLSQQQQESFTPVPAVPGKSQYASGEDSSFGNTLFSMPSMDTVSLESRYAAPGNETPPENQAAKHNQQFETRYKWQSPSYAGFRPNRNSFPIRHNPLYFEDPNLERCGISHGCLTDAVSIIHFAARIPALPYLAAADHPTSCVRAKPDCPTCHQFGPDAYFPHPGEIDLSAAAIQGAATVGLIFLIP